MNQVWTNGEKAFIRDNADRMIDKELAAQLTKTSGRTVTIQAIRKQRQKLGIQKARGRGICAVVQKKSNSHLIAQAIPATQPDQGS